MSTHHAFSKGLSQNPQEPKSVSPAPIVQANVSRNLIWMELKRYLAWYILQQWIWIQAEIAAASDSGPWHHCCAHQGVETVSYLLNGWLQLWILFPKRYVVYTESARNIFGEKVNLPFDFLLSFCMGWNRCRLAFLRPEGRAMDSNDMGWESFKVIHSWNWTAVLSIYLSQQNIFDEYETPAPKRLIWIRRGLSAVVVINMRLEMKYFAAKLNAFS